MLNQIDRCLYLVLRDIVPSQYFVVRPTVWQLQKTKNQTIDYFEIHCGLRCCLLPDDPQSRGELMWLLTEKLQFRYLDELSHLGLFGTLQYIDLLYLICAIPTAILVSQESLLLWEYMVDFTFCCHL